MIHTVRAGLLVVLVVGARAGQVQAQGPGLPPAPVPVLQPALPPTNPGQTNAVPPITIPGPGAGPYVPSQPFYLDQGPPPPPPPNEPRFAPAGLYGTLEIALLYPELHGWLSSQVNVKGPGVGFTDTVALRGARLEGTGSPRLEVGWRFTDGMGAVALTYRSVVSRGHAEIPNWDFFGTGFETSRLNLNLLDLDYVSPAYNIAPFWDFAWRAGVRGSATFFDHDVMGAEIEQHASSNFFGGGPHATVEVGRVLEHLPGWAVTSKLDGGVMIGQVTQHFNDNYDFGNGIFAGGSSRHSSTQTVPMLTYTLGLTYSPPTWGQWMRLGFGYQFEYWWNLGNSGPSRGDLTTEGVYFRGEFNF